MRLKKQHYRRIFIWKQLKLSNLQVFLEIWVLYISAIVLGFCGAVFSPAAGAIIPNIIEDEQLPQATSANQFTTSFCTMIGLLYLGFITLIGIPWFIPQFRSCLQISDWGISAVWAITSAMSGIVVNFFTIPMYLIFQQHTSDDYRGRFWELENSLRTLAMSGGFFIAGFLAQKVWLGFLFLGNTIVLWTISLWASHRKTLKELNE